MSLVVAAFDFDGTISRRDSLLPFLVSVRGPAPVGIALARLSPQLLSMAAGRADRERTKERLVTALLAGHPADDLDGHGRRFAGRLHGRLRPEMVERVRWHREQGHELVMISASPTVYLDPLGAVLGFDAVLGTRLEIGPDGRLTGRLEGANVRGAEKVVRLRAWLDGREPDELWAYGDSSGDDELLALADHPHRL